ncbi:hypothetical protein HDV00_000144 [Rhizophlyctis rosea]|nr:hypothetical protein HDV00_000144 [Rhizophlyctis rosea]
MEEAASREDRPAVADDGGNKSKRSSRRTRKRSNKKAKEGAQRTKAVIRRLPPNLPEEIFTSSVGNWLPETDLYEFVPGKLAKSKAKENVFSRAYMNFKNIDDLVTFAKAYAGHLFVDSRGNEHRAVVEFAPYQRIPRKRKKVDPRMNTIEQDPDYLAFLESLRPQEETESSIPTGESSLEKLENRVLAQQAELLATTFASSGSGASSPRSTPLLDDLRAKKAAKKSAQAQNAAKRADSTKSSAQGKKSSEQQPIQRSQKQQQKASKKQQEVQRPSSAPPGEEPKQPIDDSKKRPIKRIAPSGSLFKASIANVLGGAKEPRRPKEKQSNEQTVGSTKDGPQQKEEVAVDPGPSDANLKEGRGRGYRKSKQSKVEGGGSETIKQPDSPGRQHGRATLLDQPSQDTRPRPALSHAPSKDSLHSATPKPEDGNTGEVGGGRNRRRRRGRSDVGSAHNERDGVGANDTGRAERAGAKAGPSVVIMRRDGTTSSFKVGTSDENAKA